MKMKDILCDIRGVETYWSGFNLNTAFNINTKINMKNLRKKV